MAAASEKARLIVTDVETLRLHYAYTLRALVRPRDRAREAEIVAIYDERFFRMWEFYLAGALVMFESGAACNFQVQYIRNRRALPITRDYMAEAEARYRARYARKAPDYLRELGQQRRRRIDRLQRLLDRRGRHRDRRAPSSGHRHNRCAGRGCCGRNWRR